jgi:hypothetical protein
VQLGEVRPHCGGFIVTVNTMLVTPARLSPESSILTIRLVLWR